MLSELLLLLTLYNSDLGHVETLKLFLVEIDGDDTVHTSGLEHLGDVCAGQTVVHGALFSNASITIVRNNRTNAIGGGTAGSTDEQEQFHDVVVHLQVIYDKLIEYRRTGGLDEEDLLTANVTVDLDVDFVVVESSHLSIN